MSAASMLTRNTRNTVGSLAAIASKTRPVTKITLDGQDDNYLKSYTTRDEVKGTVSITAPMDCRFEEIYITLEGWTMTYVDNAGAAAPTNARRRGYHKHLIVRQPIDPELYPHPRIAERGRAYEFPFSFIIPEELPITACTHTCANDAVVEEHKKLPPSLGDPATSGQGYTLLDDLAPHMSKIFYAVRVRVTCPRSSDGKEVDLVDVKQKIRLVPEVQEHPPINVEDNVDDNVLRRERQVRKGTFQKRLGTLSAETNQPPSLVLPPPSAIDGCPTTTSATVHLRFDPVYDHLQPPRLGSVTTRIKASTYYSSDPVNDFPHTKRTVYNSTRGLYAESIKLSARCASEVAWRRHDACSGLRKDHSDSSSRLSDPDPVTSPSTKYAGGVFYTTKILVPVALPKTKAWTPTFHSCLVSRVYQLELALSIVTPSKSLLKNTITLRVPVQISATGGPREAPPPLMSEEEVAAIFSPRNTIAPPVGGFADDLPPSPDGSPPSRQSIALAATAGAARPPPPGYSFLAGASHGVPVRIPSPYGFSPGCG